MRKFYSLIVVCLLVHATMAQIKRSTVLSVRVQNFKQQKPIRKIPDWFSTAESRLLPNNSGNEKMQRVQILHPDKQAIALAYREKRQAIEILIPYLDNSTYTLELLEQPINSKQDFLFGTLGIGGIKTSISTDPGLHYRGCIKDDSSSFAAVSLFENGEVMILFSNKKGNFIVGKASTGNEYCIYNSINVQVPEGFHCAVDDYTSEIYNLHSRLSRQGNVLSKDILCNKVRCYWETDYALYRYVLSSDLVALQHYLTGIFNIVAAIYLNEGITLELSECYAWTTQDPYRTYNSGQGLDDFKNRWNAMGSSFNGDIAHLISGVKKGNGGLAFVASLCNRFQAYGYSNVHGQYSSLPAYSWDAYVITHEIGHNLGSLHTQWCGWNTGAGNTCGAIDNCHTLESSDNCTTCGSTYDINALPEGWSGTIMSYCHLASDVGISLANGFGPLPQGAIRYHIWQSGCLAKQSFWNGETDSLWERVTNWSCSNIPDSSTDVVLNNLLPNYPVINSNAVVHSIKVNPGASLKVKSNFSLTLKKTAPVYNKFAPPSSGKLYITGDATEGGWMVNNEPELISQRFTKLTDNIFQLSNFPLLGGKSYLMVPVYGSWDNKYGFWGASNGNNVYIDGFAPNGGNIMAPPTSDLYNIYVNFTTGTFWLYKAEPKVNVPEYNELFITGGATPGGWMNTGATPLLSQKFTKISNTLYELSSIYLSSGGSYLLMPVYGDYTHKYGGIDSQNNLNNVMGDVIAAEGSDLIAPATSGNYKIYVDFQTGRFMLTQLF